MRLTIEENRHTLKRYGHVGPAPRGVPRCSARCPGTPRVCTRRKGHSGPHIAHGLFGRVVAAWDETAKPRELPQTRRKPATATRRRAPEDGGAMSLLKGLGARVLRRIPTMEEGLLILLALGMLGMAVDIALRILGWK